MRISHYFFYYGPGAIVSKQNGRIWFIGIIPEPNKFFAPDELQKIEHETVLIQLVGSYISNLLSSNNPLQQRPISIKKLVPDRERIHCLDKSFFANGWKVCKRRKDHPGNAEVVFKSENNSCPVCGKHQSVYAFYFIGVCSNGHLCQPNWWEIVHYETNGVCPNSSSPSYLEFKGSGATLQDYTLRCPHCGAKLRMIDVISLNSSNSSENENNSNRNKDLKSFLRCCNDCPGTPGSPDCDGICNNTLKVTRYISSYLRYAVNYEFLFFLFNSDFLRVLEKVFEICQNIKQQGLNIDQFCKTLGAALTVQLPDIAKNPDKFNCYIDIATDIFLKSSAINSGSKYYGHVLEYLLLKALIEHYDCIGKGGDELLKPVEEIGTVNCKSSGNEIKVYKLEDFYNYLVQIGFKRVDPERGRVIRTPYRETDKDTYVALERKGEGIFFHFPELKVGGDRIHIWEDVRAEFKSEGDKSAFAYRFTDPDDFIDATPEYVYLHTLAHLLIKAINKIAGYSIASIRDRVYLHRNPKGDWEGGILIYVGGEDVDGSMGGLTGIFNNPKTLKEVFENVNKLIYCSNDPLCLEQKPKSKRPYGAACHLCLFLPETACGYFNLFLDRQLYLDNRIDISECEVSVKENP